MDEAKQQDQSPAQFLADVAKGLKAKADVDQELAAIVEKHILVGAADEKAVANAKAAIVALAAQRAKPKAEVNDG